MPEAPALLVCAATAHELACAAPSLIASEDELAELRPIAARLNGQPALFCVTGVGPINAALALGFCFGLTSSGAQAREDMASLRIGRVLNIGLAGGFDLELTPLRSLCVITEEIWPEYGLHDGISVTAQAFSYPQWRKADGAPEDVYDRLSLADASELARHKPDAGIFRSCRSLTVAGVSASFARAHELANRYQAQLENMEGFAVAYACARAGVPCAEIRAVSNKVGPRSSDEKDFGGALKALGGILPALGLL